MAFVKGQSGNPRGKPPGAVSKSTKLRRSIEKDVPGILEAMVERAKAGDAQAAKLLLDRVMPAIKPTDQAVNLPLAGEDLATDGRAILTATGKADITPEQASKLLAGLGALARIVETTELVQRIEKLEAANAKSN